MKKLITVFLLMIMCQLAMSKNNFFQIEKMQLKGQYLEAMDAVCAILAEDNNNRWAINFIHNHWDKAMRVTNQRLAELTDPNDVKQSAERSYIYLLLEQINDNLRTVSMPLYGPNNKWVWQPEISYYGGHYNDEHVKALKLFDASMQQAVMQEDTLQIEQLKSDSLRWRL